MNITYPLSSPFLLCAFLYRKSSKSSRLDLYMRKIRRLPQTPWKTRKVPSYLSRKASAQSSLGRNKRCCRPAPNSVSFPTRFARSSPSTRSSCVVPAASSMTRERSATPRCCRRSQCVNGTAAMPQAASFHLLTAHIIATLAATLSFAVRTSDDYARLSPRPAGATKRCRC